MDATRLIGLGVAAALAGVVNSIAGGGSLITFPVLLWAGFSPVVASATNTVSQTPGGIASAIAYRRELRPRRRLAFVMALPAALGGLVGASALLLAPARVFEIVVPWLVLGATLLLVVDDAVRRRARAAASGAASRSRKLGVAIAIGVVAIYGGYFGAGIGIVLLALLSLLGKSTIHELNAVKSVVNAAINGAAAACFFVTRSVDLMVVVVMSVGAIAGGFGGASVARRVEPKRVRWAVIAIGASLSVLLAVRYYR